MKVRRKRDEKPQDVSVLPLDDFDSLYSSKELGCIASLNEAVFRLFAPRADSVKLVLFDTYEDEKGREELMTRDSEGVWEYFASGALHGSYYGYRVSGPTGQGEMFNPNVLIGDPYSKAVVTKNNYHLPAKTLILDTQFDWEGDTFVIPRRHARLIIYEGHVRDLTAHPSSGARSRGTYKGLMDPNCAGGISYLCDLGINALELMPVHKFGTVEAPYRDANVPREGGELNTWNPYERNHWGYMTSYFFAPETYYATDGTSAHEGFNGADGRAVRELKELIKAIHRRGIAVILDVVYNHVSQYDFNPFKFIDKRYYFHCDPSGDFLKASGCGNDFNTTRPMSKRLIVDSVKYWMRDYHIDGFRFDLAPLLSREVCETIAAEARKINPYVILIAEPWGGGKYEPESFSELGWASWNDRVRNLVKGENPHTGLGFIFGNPQRESSRAPLAQIVRGSLRDNGGMFLRKEDSINYLESHDGYTLGDFIRIALGETGGGDDIPDPLNHPPLSNRELSLHKLAALILFTIQGPVMLAQGQEFARSKVIAKTCASDRNIGRFDHNSYEKDNETNHLDFFQQKLNVALYNYYRGLIALRRKYPILGDASAKALNFFDTQDESVIAFSLSSRMKRFLIVLNGNPTGAFLLKVPGNSWGVLANAESVSPRSFLRTVRKTVTIPSTSGMILLDR